MALENIQRAVLDSARQEAERIIKAAGKAAEEKIDRQAEQAQREAERRFQSEARAIEEGFARKLIEFKGTANKRLLKQRDACLQHVFAQARQAILSWPRAQYAAVMRRLLKSAVGDAPGSIRVHPEDKAVFDELLTAFNANRHGNARLAIDEAAPLPDRGGFVFVSEAFEVDQTLDTLLADLEHELAPQIAAELFAG